MRSLNKRVMPLASLTATPSLKVPAGEPVPPWISLDSMSTVSPVPETMMPALDPATPRTSLAVTTRFFSAVACVIEVPAWTPTEARSPVTDVGVPEPPEMMSSCT
jgi:hypothetical protein